MKKILLGLCFCFSIVTISQTQTIVELNSGKKVEGKIVERNDKFIKLNVEGIDSTYYLDEINNIYDLPESKTMNSTGTKKSYRALQNYLSKGNSKETSAQKIVEMGLYIVRITAECPSDKVTTIVNKKTKESLYAFSCANIRISIQNEMLFVNGKYYGELQSADLITLDDEKVLINGRERQVKAFPQEKILAKLRPKKTKEVISGYDVIFIPGFQGFKRFFSNGEETLDSGRIKVTIGDDKLTVNGRDCGQLIRGDTILIQDDDVIVSGQKR